MAVAKGKKGKRTPRNHPPRAAAGAVPRAAGAREKLLAAGTELLRRDGYAATAVDDICARAGVTKGAFFHHFAGKEALAEGCLQRWAGRMIDLESAAPFQSVRDPLEKLLAYMDFFIGVFASPNVLKSCLAGTTVQEVSETHPALRDAANRCFTSAEARLKSLLDAALAEGGGGHRRRTKAPSGSPRPLRGRRERLDTASLTRLWMATIQGSLILAKAARDDGVIPGNLRHVKEYIRGQIVEHRNRKRPPKRDARKTSTPRT